VDGVDERAHVDAFHMRPIACPTCEVFDARIVGMRGGHYHRAGLGVATTIVRCRRCGLVFPSPFPFASSPEALYDDPETYFRLHDSAEKVRGNRLIVREALRLLGTEAASLLDVGSGRGEFVRAAELEGLTDIVGLEFSPHMVEDARRVLGVHLVLSTLEAYTHEHARLFDAVILNAVIEHVYDPNALMASVALAVRPGGVVYIDTPREPNLRTYVGNAVNRVRGTRAIYNLSPTWPPFHVFGFNPRAIRALLFKHGFEVISLRVFGNPRVLAAGPLAGRKLSGWAATGFGHLANMLRLGDNMFVWARYCPGGRGRQLVPDERRGRRQEPSSGARTDQP
jgi:SAM-dependent methyltransferase